MFVGREEAYAYYKRIGKSGYAASVAPEEEEEEDNRVERLTGLVNTLLERVN